MKRYVVRYTSGPNAGKFLPPGKMAACEEDMADARVFRGTGPANAAARYSVRPYSRRASRRGDPVPEYELLEVELVRVDA